MADKLPSPDIAKPRGRVPEWVWWAAAVAAVGVFGIVAYSIKARAPAEATKPQTIITSSNIPDDFFASAQRPAADEKAEKAETEKAAAEKAAEAAKKEKLTVAPPQRVTAKELFNAQPVSMAPPAPDPVEQMNAKRRAGGAAKVARASAFGDGDAIEWVNTQETWEEEEKTVASYPTDLSRVITANKSIPGILVNAINSELAGKLVATIEENIYGGHSRLVLIPAGSQAVGRYKALAKPGDERIPVIWERIITPDGVNIHMGNAEMADAMGRAGITGDVDNRFMDRYGMALLVSTISAATAYQVPVTNQGQQVVVQAYGSNVAGLSNQILEKNINIKPRVEIPAGQRIVISPQRDIWFKKPERMDVMAVALESISQLKGSKRQ